MKNKIQDVLKVLPQLNGINFEVKELYKKDENEKLNENAVIKNVFNEKDVVYFNLELKEVILFVDMTIVIEDGNEIENKSFHFEIKNERVISEEDLKDTLMKKVIYIWTYRNKENNEEKNDDIKNIQSLEEENEDYYFVYKLDILKIENKPDHPNNNKENPVNGRQSRSKSTRKKRSNEIDYLGNNIKRNGSSKILVEMDYIEKEKKQKKEKFIFSIDNKIECTITFLNFTNFIFRRYKLDEEKYARLQQCFNVNFENFYTSISLEKTKGKIFLNNELHKNLFYIIKKEVITNNDEDKNEKINNTDKNDKDEKKINSRQSLKEAKTGKERGDKVLNWIKNIEYQQIIDHLKPYVFGSYYTKQDQTVVMINLHDLDNLDEIKNEQNKNENGKKIENILQINDKDKTIYDNIKNDLIKKGILIIVIIILLFIIIIKLFI